MENIINSPIGRPIATKHKTLISGGLNTMKNDYNITKDYQKQTEDFLKATGTTFKAKFKKYGKHFADDKVSRNIYRISLKRNGKFYNFNFGQSIQNTLKNIPPTAYDVLTCLQKYDVGSFEDFCSEFGYDIDSRKAEKIYKAVLKEFENVDRLFSDVMDKLAEIA
jgi:hypothetical protein